MKDLIHFLQRKISPEDLALLKAEMDGLGEVDYGAVVRNVVARVKKDEELFGFARSRLRLRYSDLVDLPAGRRLTILRNSSPVLLLVFFRDLIEQSWADRFGDIRRSLDLAGLAVEVAEVVVSSPFLGGPDSADLLTEAHAFLANAQRINSDVAGAERSLHRAESHLAAGTGDRSLKADVLMLLAFLRATQGRCADSAALFDKELVLRRLLGDEKKLGFALVQRGWIACFLQEPPTEITEYFSAGLSLVPEDHRLAVQALQTFAEYSAREGHSSTAWRMLTLAETPLQNVEGEAYRTDHRWITGLAHRAVREMHQAERLLNDVRQQFIEAGATERLALVSLDLASVYAAQSKFDLARQVAADAYRILKAKGLEEDALVAVLVLREALEAERATEGLAVAVANFLARFPCNKALRFEWKDD